MIQATPHLPVPSKWQFPIDVNRYDRQPELSELERLALVQALRHCLGRKKTQLPRRAEQILARLILPPDDILRQLLSIQTESCIFPIQIMLSGMNEYALPYWA